MTNYIEPRHRLIEEYQQQKKEAMGQREMNYELQNYANIFHLLQSRIAVF